MPATKFMPYDVHLFLFIDSIHCTAQC